MVYASHNTIRAYDGLNVVGNFNVIHGSGQDVIITGNHNTVSVRGCVVTGNSNRVCGANSTVTGNHNTVSGDDCVVVGNHNKISGARCRAQGLHNIVAGYNRATTPNVIPPIPPIPAIATRNRLNQGITIMASPIPPITSRPPSPLRQPTPPPTATTEALDPRHDVQADEDSRACEVCMTMAVSVILRPCNHAKLCRGCVAQIKKNGSGVLICPDCRVESTGCEVIYL